MAGELLECLRAYIPRIEDAESIYLDIGFAYKSLDFTQGVAARSILPIISSEHGCRKM